MNILVTTDVVEGAVYAAQCLKQDGPDGLIVFFHKSTFLQTGTIKTSDKKAARDLGIPVWEANHMGGSIVCFDGDLSICMTSNSENDFGERLFEASVEYLINKGINIVTDGHDILADGKKIMTWAKGVSDTSKLQTVAHFSVNIDLDLIMRLCTKPMERIPGALSVYGITAEELYDEVVEPLLEGV